MNSMYNKKYILEKIEEFNEHNYIYDDMEGNVCYLAYFKEGERGWFLHETNGLESLFMSAHRIHTSTVENVEYLEDAVIVKTRNTRFTFRLIDNKS